MLNTERKVPRLCKRGPGHRRRCYFFFFALPFSEDFAVSEDLDDSEDFVNSEDFESTDFSFGFEGSPSLDFSLEESSGFLPA